MPAKAGIQRKNERSDSNESWIWIPAPTCGEGKLSRE
jgi:hypothetical protein